MSRSWKVLCTLMAALSAVSGCQTLSYAPGNEAATRELKIHVGDQIRVVTTRRERVSLTVTEVRADRFVGNVVNALPDQHRPVGETMEVPFDELAVIQVTRPDPTRAAVGVAAVLVTLTAIGAVLSAVPAVGWPAPGAGVPIAR